MRPLLVIGRRGCALVWRDSGAKDEESESERVGALRQRASVADPLGVGDGVGSSVLFGVTGERVLIPRPIVLAGERQAGVTNT